MSWCPSVRCCQLFYCMCRICYLIIHLVFQTTYEYIKLYELYHESQWGPWSFFLLRNWLPGLTVSFFCFNRVVTHMMNFLLPCSLVSLKHFEDLVECHLEIHIDWINCVTVRTGSLFPGCSFTSSKELSEMCEALFLFPEAMLVHFYLDYIHPYVCTLFAILLLILPVCLTWMLLFIPGM